MNNLKTFEQFGYHVKRSDLVFGEIYKDSQRYSTLVYLGYFKLEGNYIGNKYRFFMFNRDNSPYVSYTKNLKDMHDIRNLKPLGKTLYEYLEENMDQAVIFLDFITGVKNPSSYKVRKTALDNLYNKIKTEKPELIEKIRDYQDLDQIGLI